MIMAVLTERTGWFGLLFIAVIMLVWMLLLFRAKKNPSKGSIGILEERLEKGELTQEEYDEAIKQQIR